MEDEEAAVVTDDDAQELGLVIHDNSNIDPEKKDRILKALREAMDCLIERYETLKHRQVSSKKNGLDEEYKVSEANAFC